MAAGGHPTENATEATPPDELSPVRKIINSFDLARYGGESGAMQLLCYLADIQKALRSENEASLSPSRSRVPSGSYPERFPPSM